MANGASTRVYRIGGYDVTKRLIDVKGLSAAQAKPEWGGMPEIPAVELNFINQRGEMSSVSPIGLFYGIMVKSLTLEIVRKQGSLEFLEWFGNVDSVTELFLERRTQVRSVSPFSSKLDLPAQITLDIGTPAFLSQRIFQEYDIPINAASYNAADAYLSSLVTVQVDPDLINGAINLMELQKQLANAGFGRIYFYNGEMYFDVFRPTTPTITFDLGQRDLMTNPIVETEEKKPTSYIVKWIRGQVESPSFVEGGASDSRDFGPSQTVKVRNESSALAIADNLELISQLVQRRVSFGVKHNVGQMLELGSYVTLTWKRGGFDATPLEIVSIDRSDIRYTVLQGLTTSN